MQRTSSLNLIFGAQPIFFFLIPVDYNDIMARHYASYRPPLHRPILKTALGTERFGTGLDVGCGTGISTKALLAFCRQVVGTDPSEAMLSQAKATHNTLFCKMTGNKLPFPDAHFDICTYAGSWWYGKSDALLQETLRVTAPNGTLLLYDFEVRLAPYLDLLQLTAPPPSGYDHRADFSGFAAAPELLTKQQREFSLDMDPTSMAHLLCADANLYGQLTTIYGETHLFERLVQELQRHENNKWPAVMAVAHLSRYRAHS
ncbi:class I SAM-dependent methyltransferase [Maribacter sp. 2307ULW6-5]|uniref:class I SAM-dependent methyltransferase n=1 Tax=Maribacter sp. 2307ULW6-5 TaxID=3386275 RepID=UPI0039BC2AED